MNGNPHFSYVFLPYAPTFSCADNILFGCCAAVLCCSRIAARPCCDGLHGVFAVAAVFVLVIFLVNHGLEWQGPDHPLHRLVPTLGFSLLGIGSTALIAMVLAAVRMDEVLFPKRCSAFLWKVQLRNLRLSFLYHQGCCRSLCELSSQLISTPRRSAWFSRAGIRSAW